LNLIEIEFLYCISRPFGSLLFTNGKNQEKVGGQPGGVAIQKFSTRLNIQILGGEHL